jgi:hypothetical protein
MSNVNSRKLPSPSSGGATVSQPPGAEWVDEQDYFVRDMIRWQQASIEERIAIAESTIKSLVAWRQALSEAGLCEGLAVLSENEGLKESFPFPPGSLCLY